MTLELELKMNAGKLWINKYDINDIVFNYKNPQKIYYRVIEMNPHSITGGYQSLTIFYSRQISYTGSVVPTNSPNWLPVGSLYDLSSISSNQQATLFQQYPMVKYVQATGFVQTAEKTELPLFMMRSMTEVQTLVYFSLKWFTGSTDIHSGHDGEAIQLKLQLYTR